MTWVKLDDGFFQNRKARAVGLEGRSLYLASACWCAQQQNDGVFFEDDLPIIAPLAGVAPDVSEVLFKWGLWEQPEPGLIAVHDYLTYNPTREQIVARSQQASFAANKRHAERTTNRSTDSTPVGSALGCASPDPTPTPSSSSTVTQTAPPEIWEMLAKKKLATAKNVGNPIAWCQKVARNDRTEMGDRADYLWTTWTMSKSQLVDILASGGTSPLLNSLPRRQP